MEGNVTDQKKLSAWQVIGICLLVFFTLMLMKKLVPDPSLLPRVVSEESYTPLRWESKAVKLTKRLSNHQYQARVVNKIFQLK